MTATRSSNIRRNQPQSGTTVREPTIAPKYFPLISQSIPKCRKGISSRG